MVSNQIRLILDLEKQIDTTPANPAEPCGNYSILATGLTREQILTAQFPFQVLFQLKEYPFDSPTLEELKTTYKFLFGVTI